MQLNYFRYNFGRGVTRSRRLFAGALVSADQTGDSLTYGPASESAAEAFRGKLLRVTGLYRNATRGSVDRKAVVGDTLPPHR